MDIFNIIWMCVGILFGMLFHFLITDRSPILKSSLVTSKSVVENSLKYSPNTIPNTTTTDTSLSQNNIVKPVKFTCKGCKYIGACNNYNKVKECKIKTLQ